MDFIGDVISFVTNPISTLISGSFVLVLYYGYKALVEVLKPFRIVLFMYGLMDTLMCLLDDHVIDKINHKDIKNDIQVRLRDTLIQRKKKIGALIEKISD